MMAIQPTSRHPSAGELVRQLDDELDPRTRARLAAHLERCADCRSRLSELDARGREAGTLFRTSDVPDDLTRVRRRASARSAVLATAERRRAVVRGRRGWAAAATVAALLLISLSVDPLRAWVVERLSLAGFVGEAPGERIATLPSAVVGSDGSVISFQPGGAVFELSVERRQSEGELLLQVSDLGRATAQVTNGAAETVLVLPAGLRVENSSASRASYRITLPSSVRQVVVRIGDDAPTALPVHPGTRYVTPLASPR